MCQDPAVQVIQEVPVQLLSYYIAMAIASLSEPSHEAFELAGRTLTRIRIALYRINPGQTATSALAA